MDLRYLENTRFKILYFIYLVPSLSYFQVVTANIYDADSMVTHFQGQDAVLSCLGCPPSYFSLRTITFYTDTAKHIVAALRKAAVKRFVFMSSWYTKCMGYYVLENLVVRACVRVFVSACACVHACVRACVSVVSTCADICWCLFVFFYSDI